MTSSMNEVVSSAPMPPSSGSNRNLIVVGALFLVIILLIGGIFLVDIFKPKNDLPANDSSLVPTQSVLKPIVDSEQIMNRAVGYAAVALKPSYSIDVTYASPSAEGSVLDGKVFTRKNAVTNTEYSQLVYTIGPQEVYWGSFVAIQETGLANNDLDTFLTFFGKYFNVPNVSENAWNKSVNKLGNTQFEFVTDNPDGSYNTISGYALPEPGKNTFSIIGLACHRVPENPDFSRHTCVPN